MIPEEKPPQSLFARRRLRMLYLAGIAVAIVLLAYRLSAALNPLLLALLIAYILDPLVGFLERRLGLNRTAAILLIYVAGAGAVAAGAWYGVGKTLVGVDKVLVKIEGGWQSAPGGPIYGDDQIRVNPQSGGGGLYYGWLDLNPDGKQETSEPTFYREAGRWKPAPEWAGIVRRVPGYIDEIRARIAKGDLPVVSRDQVEALSERVKEGLGAVVAAGGAVWRWLTERFFAGFTTVVLYAVLVPVYTFFLLRGFDAILARMRQLLPGRYRDRALSIATRIDRACAAFFRGRFLICMGKGALTWLGLWLVGVEFALLIGIVAGVLSLIPAVGPIAGMLLAVVCSYGPDAWFARIVGAAVVFVAVEVVEAVANPVVLGREVGLHPVTLLVALFIFGDLFGLFGVLLAVPLAAIAKILAQEFVLPELEHFARETPDMSVSGFFHVFREAPAPGTAPPLAEGAAERPTVDARQE